MTKESDLLPAIGEAATIDLRSGAFTLRAEDRYYPNVVWIIDPSDDAVWAWFDRGLIEDLPVERQRMILEPLISASWSGFENGYELGKLHLKRDFRRLLDVEEPTSAVRARRQEG